MTEKIQELLDSLERYNTKFVKIDEMEVGFTMSYMGFEMFHIMVNGNLIHNSRNRSSIRNILKEWRDGKRELKKVEDYGLLFKC